MTLDVMEVMLHTEIILSASSSIPGHSCATKPAHFEGQSSRLRSREYS